MTRIRSRAAALLVGAAAVLALTGCSPTVDVPKAAGGDAKGCAAVVVRLPSTVDGAAQRQVDQQGTAAWGDGNPPSVVLRCGVTPPGPTTATCTPVDGVDFLIRAVGRQQYVVTTFGRTPATQIDLDQGRVDSGTVLPPIADAIAGAIPHATGHCTVSGTSGSTSPTPSPTP